MDQAQLFQRGIVAHCIARTACDGGCGGTDLGGGAAIPCV